MYVCLSVLEQPQGHSVRPGSRVFRFVSAAAEQAQRVVKIKMNFPSSVFCNNAGKNVLDKRIREALQKLNKNWNFCINTVEGGSGDKEFGFSSSPSPL